MVLGRVAKPRENATVDRVLQDNRRPTPIVDSLTVDVSPEIRREK